MIAAVYFTNWSIYDRQYAPHQLPLDVITHVLYAFGKPEEDTGVIASTDPWADFDKPMHLGGQGCIGEFALLKQQKPHLRLLLSVGGWSFKEQLGVVLRDPKKREAFVASAVEWIDKYGFDGIDIDWEYPENATDSKALLSTMTMLRKALGPEKDLMLAAPAADTNIRHFPIRDLEPVVTSFNIMAYDFSGPWSHTAEHHANLSSVSPSNLSAESVVGQYTRLVRNPEKIVLGIPLYGRSFAQAHAIGDLFHGALPGQFEHGVHDVKALPLPGHSEYVDERLGAALCTDGRNMASYDTPRTVELKADLVRMEELGGGMFWEASGDHPDGNSLIRHFVRRLHR